MSVFNYFLPDRRAVKLEDLTAVGLGYAFEPEAGDTPRSMFTPRPVTNGPGGKNGVIVSPSDRLVGYFRKDQVWLEDPAGYWVGYWKDNPPTPDTLKRENQIPGAWIRLDDGNAWLIPRARHFEEFDDGEIAAVSDLPARLTRDELGNWTVGEIKGRYRRLWDLTTAFVEAIADGRQQFAELDDLIVEAFKTNYRMAAAEIDLLGIYDDIAQGRILRILADMDGWAELVKKKQIRRDSGDSSNGQSELTPAEAAGDTNQR